MAWEYDQPPLEYLRRRFTYYVRKWRHVNKLIGSESLWCKYGSDLPQLIERRLIQIEGMMGRFELAIKILERYEPTKKKRK